MSQSYYMLLIFVVFIAIFYFMAIRPQSKQRKAHQEMMSTLKRGDLVMTSSGVYGTVKKVDESVVEIEIAKGVSMKVVRRAIADIIRDPERAKALAPSGTSSGSRASRKSAVESSEESDVSVVDDEGDSK